MAQNGGARGAAKDVEDKAEKVADHPWMEKAARAGFIMSGVVHLLIGWIALQVGFGTGGGSDSGEQTSQITGMFLQNAAGRILVGIAGLVVIGIDVYHVVKGITRKFEEDLKTTGGGNVGKAVVVTGVAGYVAKGLALAGVGVLFGWAAIGADAEKATGMDGAIKQMATLPAGTVLLAVVGAGLILYGIYSILRARYASM